MSSSFGRFWSTNSPISCIIITGSASRSGSPAFCSGGIRSYIGSIAAFCNSARKFADDHVLQSHSDGREFARVLVDLAARLTDLPRVPATLAILETSYSDFQHRIKNLLDKERIIVTRINGGAVFS